MPVIKVKRPTNIVLDIYGTITSVKFIDELRQFAMNNMEKYLKEHWGDRRLVRLLDKLRNEATKLDNKEGMPEILDYSSKENAEEAQKSVAEHIKWRISMEHDSQYILYLWEGVWEDGYKSKELKSHVFEDVPRVLKHWRYEQYIKIYTLASGQRKGQHVFLKSTIHGDLVNLIANYLDCSAYGKEDRRCYTNIKHAIREKAENLLFVTDNPREAQAALDERFQAIVIVREGNEPLTDEDRKKYNVVTTFDEIQFLDPLPDALAGVQKCPSLTDVKTFDDNKQKPDTKMNTDTKVKPESEKPSNGSENKNSKGNNSTPANKGTKQSSTQDSDKK